MSVSWRRTTSVLGIVAAGLLVLIITLLLILWLLLATQRGTQIVINMAERFAPGELQVDYQGGSLAGTLTLDRVQYTHANIDLEVVDLTLAWHPSQLLKRTLYVEELSFNGLNAVITPAEPTPEPEPNTDFSLPDIDLPLDVVIQSMQLRDLNLTIAETSQYIERIELRAHSQGSVQRIEHLLLRSDIAAVTLHGEVETQGSYQLDLSADAQLNLPDLQAIQLNATAHGNLDTLNVAITSAGLADAQVQASLANVTDLSRLHWDAALELDAVRHPSVTALTNSVNIALHSTGNIDTFALVLDAAIDSVEQGLVELSSEVHWRDLQLDIEHLYVTSEDLDSRFDVVGFARFGELLEIDIQGEAEALGFTHNQFSLTANGDQQGIDTFTLELDLPQAGALVTGSFAWAPYLSWDVQTSINRLDFYEISDVLNGGATVEIVSHGTFDEQLNVYARIDEMRGSLLGNPLFGQGQVQIDGGSYTARDLNLRWGDAQLHADGNYSSQGIDLEFILSVPDAATLLAGAQGSLHARGDVSGNEHAPQLNISVSAEALQWQQYQLDTLVAAFTIDGTFAHLPTGELNASGINIDTQSIEQLNVRMRQDRQHHIEADVDYGDLEARLALAGDWNYDELSWQGQLQRLQLRYPEISRWNLAQPANLLVSPRQAQLSDFCLAIATQASEICAQAEWQQQNQHATLNLVAERIPYQMFEPWIPDDILLLGEFSLHVDVLQQQDTLSVDSRLEIADTSVRVPAQELRVDFNDGEVIRLQGDQQQLDMHLRLLSEQLEGGIESHASVFSVLEDSRRVEGEFGIDVRSFVLLSVLVPDVQDVSGHLSGRIDFAGEVDELLISGGLELRDGHAQIPATGLELRNLNLALMAPTTNEEPFTLAGDVDAGDGQLHIEGAYYLRDQRALLSIEGAAFPALNTRDLQVTIAPDLQIEYTPELLRLRGAVSVPSARITPPDFESVDSISNDTVIVGGEGTPYDQSLSTLPIDMDVTVNLGDDVQISAYGFEGRLEGGLRIIEQTGQETTAVGNIDVASGAYEIYGQALNIERGRLIFTGGPVANPGLDLRVERNIDNQSVTVGARVGGTLENPTFNLFSTPNMQDSAILSYLIFGRGPGEGNSGEQNMLARATLALGMSGGNRLGERLSDTLGVDEISLDSGDTFESTALFIGKQISSRLYIKYGVGLVEPVSTFFIQYRLTDNLNFESHTGNEHSGADFFYIIER